MKTNTNKMSVKTLTLGAILTALVILLQFMGSFIKLGMFSVSLVLIPIVIGAAMCGKYIGAWLGFVFSIVVLLSGDAAAFLAVDILGTVVTVILKGTLCGLAAGIVYDIFSKKNRYLGVFAAAIVCPIVNTGIFLLGCSLFFMDTVAMWASQLGFGSNVVAYMFLGLAGGNFLFELLFNIVLSPIIVRLLNASKKI